jgi:hypothetical protein
MKQTCAAIASRFARVTGGRRVLGVLGLLGWLALAASVQAVLGCSRACAQVVVLRIDPAAEAMSQQLEGALSQFGLVPDPGYFMEAQRQGLDPASDQALTMLTPPAGAQLAVVPRAEDAQSVVVEFRDGGSGASLGTTTLPLRRGVLRGAGREALAAEVNARLSGQDGTEPAASGDAGSQADSEPGAAADEDRGALAEGESETGLRLRAFAGAGLGTRRLEWPTPSERRAVETGGYVAVEIGTAFALELDPELAFGSELVYQTSLDNQLEETHIAGATDTIQVRTHRFAAVLELIIGAHDGVRVAPGLGYGVRALHPEVHHLLTPSYSLTGPLARIALRIAFGESVALRVVPEAQWLMVGDALEALGVASSGISLGGDAALELVLGGGLTLELSYREAHAIMSSSLGKSASDVERFATLRAVWTP